MDTLDTVFMIAVFVIALAVLLFYFTRKSPIKKLDIKKSLPVDTEFASEFSPPTPKPEPIKDYEPQVPFHYGENSIRALVRDPKGIHVHWELTEDHARNLLEGWDGNWQNNLFLRVHRENFWSLEKLYDIPISGHSRQWYLEVPDNTTIVVDLTCQHCDGRHVTLLRANPVTTPRARMSDVIDEEWMLVEENQRKLYRRIGVGYGPSSPDFYNPIKDS